MSLKFQSYLIVGNQVTRRGKTESLAKSYGINLKSTSPDLFIIKPDGQSVTIDQMRNLKKHIFQKPLKFNYKFVVIEEANKLTDEAQNALLKVLEEPPATAIIVLEADNKQQFLPTILSRVIIKRTKQSSLSASTDFNLLAKSDTLVACEKIVQCQNPCFWLANQIQIAYSQLLAKMRGGNNQFSQEELISIIEKCSNAKAMIEANVNAKFVLINLVFSLHSN